MSIQSISLSKRDAHRAFVGLLLLAGCALVFLFWSPRPQLLSMAYVGLAVLIGIWLYVFAPASFVAYALWIWFLSPFVRRIIDYRLGMYSPDPFPLLAPILVSWISVITIIRRGRLLVKRFYFPLWMMLLAIFYGFLIGLPLVGPFESVHHLIGWMAPILLSFHILTEWRSYREYREVIRQTYIWAVLIMGLYGIFQYFIAPGWDGMWMVGSKMITIGRPEPFMIRVFSTLNSPGPFAFIMMAGLLMLFIVRGPLLPFAAGAGYISFLLSLVRAAWAGWVFGLALLILRLRGKMRARLAAILVVAVFVGAPVLVVGPVADSITSRLESVGNLEQDGSYQDRVRLYQFGAIRSLLNPVGRGLGSRDVDSGFITLIWQLGWPGSFLFFGGLVGLIRQAWKVRTAETDSFAEMAAVIGITFVCFCMLFVNVLGGAVGATAMTFLTLSVGARKYYSFENDSFDDMEIRGREQTLERTLSIH